MMDHTTIERQGVIELYLAGQLSGEEEVRFEEHLLGCSSCLEALDEAEDFRQSLRAAVAERTARSAIGLGLFAALRRHAAGWIALGLLVALPLTFLLWQTRRLAVDLEHLQAARTAAPVASPLVAELEQQLRRTETELAAQRQDLEAQLERQQSLVQDLGARLRTLTTPRINTALVVLAATRGGEDGAPPVNKIPRSRSPGWLVLAMELALVEHESYQVELKDARDLCLWEQAGLRPDALDTLTVSLHTSFLSPGDYLLELAGVGPDGRAVPVGSYSFRVL